MSAEFDGTGFMDCDVSRVGAENALIGAEQRIDYGGIRLGAADEEIDACLRSTAGFAILSRADSENSSRPYPEVCIIFVERSSFMMSGWAPSM